MSVIYVNPTGWEVREFSHSQYNAYKFCPKKFWWDRVRGWKQKQRASMEFGKAIEVGVKAHYAQMDPLEQFELYWQGVKANEKIVYAEKENWEWLRLAGAGLMLRFQKDWQDFPPRNPVWPEYKHALKRKDERTGVVFQTIPDLIDHDESGEFIADIKAQGNLLDTNVPGLVIMDLQLRTQAAVHYYYSPNKTYRVALWNFCTHPKRVDDASAEEIRANATHLAVNGLGDSVALYLAHECNGMAYEKAGEFLGITNSKELIKPLNAQRKKDATFAEQLDALARTISEAHKPQYVIQWVEGTMTREHAEEGLRDELSVVPQIQAGYFPLAGGIRFPNNQCTWCSHRGLCMEELRGPHEKYTEITKSELVRFDEDSMEGWD